MISGSEALREDGSKSLRSDGISGDPDASLLTGAPDMGNSSSSESASSNRSSRFAGCDFLVVSVVGTGSAATVLLSALDSVLEVGFASTSAMATSSSAG